MTEQPAADSLERDGARVHDLRLDCAGDPKEIHAYDGADHAMRVPEARADRSPFLGRTLGWAR